MLRKELNLFKLSLKPETPWLVIALILPFKIIKDGNRVYFSTLIDILFKDFKIANLLAKLLNPGSEILVLFYMNSIINSKIIPA